MRIRVSLVVISIRRVDNRPRRRQIECLGAIEQYHQVVVVVVMRPRDRIVVAIYE